MPNVIRDVLSQSDSRLIVPRLGPCSALFRWGGDRSWALHQKSFGPVWPPAVHAYRGGACQFVQHTARHEFLALHSQTQGVYWLSASHLTPGANYFHPWSDGMPPSDLHHTSTSMMLRLRAGHRRGFGSQPKFCAIQMKHLFGHVRSNQSCATYRVLRYVSLSMSM